MLKIEEELERQGEIIIVASGISMRPMLHPDNNVLKIKKIEKPLKKYDVVLFKRGENTVLHRIIKVYENSYDISGDSTYNIERNVERDDIIGILSDFVTNSRDTSDLHWISVENGFYQFYARMVVLLMPLRRGLLGIYIKIKDRK